MLADAQVDIKPKTDEEIHQMAMTEWVDQIARLWDAIGKPLDESRLGIYRKELSVIPLGLLERVISRVIRENTYSNVPPVGTIWNALRVELGNPRDVMEAIAEWEEREWSRCVVWFGEQE